MTEQSIIEKVQAILARANHPETPQAEAETAFTMAQRLITKYNLDEAALAPCTETDDIVRDRIDIRGSWSLRRLCVASTVARANSCATYRSDLYEKDENGYYKKTGRTLHIFGTKADVFAAKTLWAAVEALGLRTIPRGDRTFRNSWWHGFNAGISKALEQAKKQVVADVVAEGGSSLVLVERFKRADSEMRATVSLRSTSSTSYARSSAGYNAGRAAGSSFSTGGIGRGAIGALGR